jgi:ABC-2 type transport system permease protein
MGLYFRVSVQNLTAYRFDFWMRLVVSMMHLASELMIVWTIFHNTDEVRGWRWQHMLILVGVFRMVAGGIRILIVPNMRKVLEDIREGTLDFVLLKPVNAQFLVSIREVVVYRVVDLVLGASVAVFGCITLSGHVPLKEATLFALTLAAAFFIVYAVWLMLATLCFWFVRVQNIEMIFWNVFEAGRYPIVIYPPWVQWTLTFILPLAFITTFPAAVLIGDEGLLRQSGAMATWLLPIWAAGFAVVMLVLSNRFWRYGLRHYAGASA